MQGPVLGCCHGAIHFGPFIVIVAGMFRTLLEVEFITFGDNYGAFQLWRELCEDLVCPYQFFVHRVAEASPGGCGFFWST